MIESIICNNYMADERAIRRLILRLKFELEHTDTGTPEYEMLSNELMKSYEIMRKCKDSQYKIKPETVATLGTIGILALIVICLSQEDPGILKFAQFIIKLFRLT